MALSAGGPSAGSPDTRPATAASRQPGGREWRGSKSENTPSTARSPARARRCCFCTAAIMSRRTSRFSTGWPRLGRSSRRGIRALAIPQRPDVVPQRRRLAYLYLDWLDRQMPGRAVRRRLVVRRLGRARDGACARSADRAPRADQLARAQIRRARGARHRRRLCPAGDEVCAARSSIRRRPARLRLADDDELTAIARDREARRALRLAALHAQPGVGHWLHRVRRRPWCCGATKTASSPPLMAKSSAAALPDARFERIAQAGHYPQIERADAVADAIEHFAAAEVTR